MPTYTYRCKSCGHELEEFQRISDEPLRTCPSCQKNSLVRIIDAGAGLHFKGSGFYLTDYKNKSSSDAEARKKDSKPKDTPPDAAPPKPDPPPKS